MTVNNWVRMDLEFHLLTGAREVLRQTIYKTAELLYEEERCSEGQRNLPKLKIFDGLNFFM